MLKKVRKIGLYYRTLHKGELLKRIEYKAKDCIGYFYIKNSKKYKFAENFIPQKTKK